VSSGRSAPETPEYNSPIKINDLRLYSKSEYTKLKLVHKIVAIVYKIGYIITMSMTDNKQLTGGSKMKITVVDQAGNEIAEVKNCKTIRGAKSQMKKSSIAFQAGWKIRIEEEIK